GPLRQLMTVLQNDDPVLNPAFETHGKPPRNPPTRTDPHPNDDIAARGAGRTEQRAPLSDHSIVFVLRLPGAHLLHPPDTVGTVQRVGGAQGARVLPHPAEIWRNTPAITLRRPAAPRRPLTHAAQTAPLAPSVAGSRQRPLAPGRRCGDDSRRPGWPAEGWGDWFGGTTARGAAMRSRYELAVAFVSLAWVGAAAPVRAAEPWADKGLPVTPGLALGLA